jgi:NADH-ubiquinone oxidoreductase chain 1
LPLLPLQLIFFIGSLAETNRAPFDLAEAESELVSGFMTEHAAVIFVFFFLAEYSSILLMCILTSSLFLGGYLLDFSGIIDALIHLIQFNDYYARLDLINSETPQSSFSPILEGLISGLVLGIKSSILVFTFI